MIWLVLAFGCGDLTPGERVLGDEVRATVFEGAPGFGASVAVDTERLSVASALQSGRWSHALEPLTHGRARRVGEIEGTHWAWLGNDTVIDLSDGSVLGRVDGATAVDVCPDGTVLWSDQAGEAVACSAHGSIWTECDGGSCAVILDEEAIATVSPGGALAWFQDKACWGDPKLEVEEASGSVRCSDGTELMGMKGDHLGLSIGGGRAAGRFNRHIVPPRLRIQDLDGGPVWLVDRAAENSRVSLDGAAGVVAVGVAQFREGPTTGRVFVVELP